MRQTVANYDIRAKLPFFKIISAIVFVATFSQASSQTTDTY